jgi:Arc/MetJ family transcription regulator
VSLEEIEIDSELVQRVIRLHGFRSLAAAVDFALRRLVAEPPTGALPSGPAATGELPSEPAATGELPSGPAPSGRGPTGEPSISEPLTREEALAMRGSGWKVRIGDPRQARRSNA